MLFGKERKEQGKRESQVTLTQAIRQLESVFKGRLRLDEDKPIIGHANGALFTIAGDSIQVGSETIRYFNLKATGKNSGIVEILLALTKRFGPYHSFQVLKETSASKKVYFTWFTVQETPTPAKPQKLDASPELTIHFSRLWLRNQTH